MASNFTSLSNIPDLMSTLRTAQKDLLYNQLNCMKVAIVDEFYPETKKVKVNIANKVLLGLNKDGTQILADYPAIFAKVCYIGWGDRGLTFPLEKGMEGFLLFNDREIESWFINGQANPLAYDRCHSLSDAVFICGIQSQPNLVDFVADCINLYYKDTFIRLLEDSISINGDTTLTGDLTATGTITGAVLVDESGATGNIVDSDGKILATVQNGIIKSIN